MFNWFNFGVLKTDTIVRHLFMNNIRDKFFKIYSGE